MLKKVKETKTKGMIHTWPVVLTDTLVTKSECEILQLEAFFDPFHGKWRSYITNLMAPDTILGCSVYETDSDALKWSS